jgi:hypothetical protein
MICESQKKIRMNVFMIPSENLCGMWRNVASGTAKAENRKLLFGMWNAMAVVITII